MIEGLLAALLFTVAAFVFSLAVYMAVVNVREGRPAEMYVPVVINVLIAIGTVILGITMVAG